MQQGSQSKLVAEVERHHTTPSAQRLTSQMDYPTQWVKSPNALLQTVFLAILPTGKLCYSLQGDNFTDRANRLQSADSARSKPCDVT